MADLVTRTQAAPVVLGAIAFGKPKATTRDHPLATDDSCNDLLRAFAELGGEELDTARLYQNGQSEAAIGRLPASAVIRVGTKYHPTLDGGPVTQMEQSLAALQRDSVSIYYIHMPSIEIPLEDTLAEINECHAAGQFERFGLSNFPAW